VKKEERSRVRYAITLARGQVDQWDHVEKGLGPEDASLLPERAETLIGILRDVAALRMPPKGS